MNALVHPWRHCFDFRGRSRRLEVLLFFATVFTGLVVVAGVGELIMGVIGAPFPPIKLGSDTFGIVLPPHGWPAAIYLMLCLVPGLALSARRLHDYGLSGLLLLAWVVPVVGLFVGPVLALVIIFLRDAEGARRYGPDPRDPEGADGTVALGEIFS